MARVFFPEVQALRALAVGLVLVYHLQPNLIGGGFIGVDVFFVVSGYLITSHLLREHRDTGRVSLSRFWAARARRILPAALVCIAVTLGASALVYPPTQWAHVGFQGVAASLSVLNWVLAAESADYMGALNEATPFQHFWSLGVEEQFYLLWPIVVLAACALAVRRGRGRGAMLSLVFGAVVVAGFGYGAAQVASGDPAAYFATTTRVWELAVGGVLAVWVPQLTLPAPARTAISIAGVVVIVSAAALIGRDDPFPGTLALLPVAGAAAVITAGATTGPVSPARLYAARPVQWIGDRSYSLYLWHFPPIVLFAVALNRPPDLGESVMLGAAAVLLAWASYRFIEQPVRRGRWVAARPQRALALGAASVAVVSVMALALPAAERTVETEWVATAAALRSAGAEGAAAMTARADDYFPSGVVGVTPSPTEADQDEPDVVKAGCTGVPRSDTTPRCTIGDPDGPVAVALVGDSHAKQFATGLDAIARDRGWRVDTFLHASCPFNGERRQVEVDGGVRCAGPNAATLKALIADPPAVVFLANWASGDFVETGTGHDPGVAGYAEFWNLLADAGSEVVVFKDVPKPSDEPLVPDCIAVHYETPGACAMPRGKAMAGRDIVDEARALAPRVHVVDLTDRLCGTTTCPAVVGNVLVYRDSNHVTDTFMRTLTPYIAERLPSDLP